MEADDQALLTYLSHIAGMSVLAISINLEKPPRLQHDFYNSILGSILLGYFFQKTEKCTHFSQGK